MEYIRFDLHVDGPSESAPHVHIRLEGRELSDYEEFIRKFEQILPVIPRIELVIK